jgi:8-hydroxy-5-deazaflavin:NADPH oxidoreductase
LRAWSTRWVLMPGWENFANPEFPSGERADLFYAGPDGPSREKVGTLVSDVGLRPVWVGGPEHVETVDGMTRLWFAVARRQRGRHTAFRTLTDLPRQRVLPQRPRPLS